MLSSLTARANARQHNFEQECDDIIRANEAPFRSRSNWHKISIRPLARFFPGLAQYAPAQVVVEFELALRLRRAEFQSFQSSVSSERIDLPIFIRRSFSCGRPVRDDLVRCFQSRSREHDHHGFSRANRSAS